MNIDERIPMPPRRWMTRIGLPVLVIGAATGLLLGTMWSSIAPARSVPVASAIVRDVDAPIEPVSDSAGTADALVQAPGWVEPDPFGVYAGALVEGIVKDVQDFPGGRIFTLSGRYDLSKIVSVDGDGYTQSVILPFERA